MYVIKHLSSIKIHVYSIIMMCLIAILTAMNSSFLSLI